MGSDEASTSASGPKATDPYTIQHMPKTKAKPPMFVPRDAEKELGPMEKVKEAAAPLQPKVELSKEQIERAYDVMEQRRFGPAIVKYTCYGSVGAIAYTYFNGFYHLAQKNKEAWRGSFRQRIFIVGPVIAMYAAANDVIPVPFKSSLESLFGRPALTLQDVVMSKKTIKAAKESPAYLQASLQ